MTVLEKIKRTGGFADFGAIGSMPLGYFMDKTLASTQEYYEIQKLKAGNKVKKDKEISVAEFPVMYTTRRDLTGDLLKCK